MRSVRVEVERRATGEDQAQGLDTGAAYACIGCRSVRYMAGAQRCNCAAAGKL
jgi:hypothetical protein